MKALSTVVLASLFLILSGCGGSGVDRTALAKTAVTTYWSDVNSAHMGKAYALLSTGLQQTRPKDQFSQDMFSFLATVGSITPSVSKPTVTGDHAVVPVFLAFSKQQKTLQAYQHLYWDNGNWRITDENGGVSQTK